MFDELCTYYQTLPGLAGVGGGAYECDLRNGKTVCVFNCQNNDIYHDGFIQYIYPYAHYNFPYQGIFQIWVGMRNVYGWDPCPPGYKRITNPCCNNADGEGFICVEEPPVPSTCFDY